MRFFFLIAVSSAAALAQTSAIPKPLPPTLQNAFRNYFQKLEVGTPPKTPAPLVVVPGLTIVPQAKTCAVPLTNLLKNTKPVPLSLRNFKPGPNGFHMKEVQVPAPSCDDKK